MQSEGEHRKVFEQDFGHYLVDYTTRPGRKGTFLRTSCYELEVDPTNPTDRRRAATFVVRALAAGYKQVLPPFVLDNVQSSEGKRRSAIYFTLENSHQMPIFQNDDPEPIKPSIGLKPRRVSRILPDGSIEGFSGGRRFPNIEPTKAE